MENNLFGRKAHTTGSPANFGRRQEVANDFCHHPADYSMEDLRDANGRLPHERLFTLQPLNVVRWSAAAGSERRVVGHFRHSCRGQ